MQKVIDRLHKTCEAYGMEINVKIIKAMIMNETAKPKRMQRRITLDMVPLEKVTRFKYLGSQIAEDARSDEDIRARVLITKAAFSQNTELVRINIHINLSSNRN